MQAQLFLFHYISFNFIFHFMLVQFAFHALVCSLNYVGLHCISVLLVLAFRFTADFCAFVHIFFPLCVVFFFGRCCCFIQYNLLWLLFLFSSTKNERKFSFCSFCSCTWNWFRKKNRSKMLEQKRRHIRRTVTEITKIIFKKSTQKIAGTHNFQYSCHSYVFGTCFYWWWIFLSLSLSCLAYAVQRHHRTTPQPIWPLHTWVLCAQYCTVCIMEQPFTNGYHLFLLLLLLLNIKMLNVKCKMKSKY